MITTAFRKLLRKVGKKDENVPGFVPKKNGKFDKRGEYMLSWNWNDEKKVQNISFCAYNSEFGPRYFIIDKKGKLEEVGYPPEFYISNLNTKLKNLKNKY